MNLPRQDTGGGKMSLFWIGWSLFWAFWNFGDPKHTVACTFWFIFAIVWIVVRIVENRLKEIKDELEKTKNKQ
jgi:hypothetical protein